MKCAFCVKSGMLLGHIVSANGIAMDPAKVVRLFIWHLFPQCPGSLANLLGKFDGMGGCFAILLMLPFL